MLGGENPELLARLMPVLSKVGTTVQAQVADALTEAQKTSQQETAQRHAELVALVTDVRRKVAVKVAEDVAARDAAQAVKDATTAKGLDYEDQVHEACAEIASGPGEEYRRCGDVAGRLPRNKKGDGLFVFGGGAGKVVIEAHDGDSKPWGEYLPEAERNRGAQASIGLVRRLHHNEGRLFRVIAPKRVVLAFDAAGEPGDLEVLRTIVMMMRTVAQTTDGRFGLAEVATANDAIREALTLIEELDEARKSAGAITTHVEKVERIVTKTMTSVQRQLNGALDALGGAVGGSDHTSDEDSTPTVDEADATSSDELLGEVARDVLADLDLDVLADPTLWRPAGDEPDADLEARAG